jgi:hypothetical protein
MATRHGQEGTTEMSVRPNIVLVSHPGDVVALGASRIRDVTQGPARWTTFADPEGNEFDLIAG